MCNNDENNIEIASVDEIIMPDMPDLPQVDVPEDAVEDIAIEEAAPQIEAVESASEIQPSSESAVYEQTLPAQQDAEQSFEDTVIADATDSEPEMPKYKPVPQARNIPASMYCPPYVPMYPQPYQSQEPPGITPGMLPYVAGNGAGLEKAQKELQPIKEDGQYLAVPQANMQTVYMYHNVSHRSRLAAGMLGLFLGGYGVHNFYLGRVGIGIAQIILTSMTCGVGALWGFIEGILILCGGIDTDAQGKRLMW